MRVMTGNPNSPYSHDRNPYVQLHKGNQYFDKLGNPINPSDPMFELKRHIPLAELLESTAIQFVNL